MVFRSYTKHQICDANVCMTNNLQYWKKREKQELSELRVLVLINIQLPDNAELLKEIERHEECVRCIRKRLNLS